MTDNNTPKEAQLWAELYALLCRFDSVFFGLASMPQANKPILDKKAEKIIKKYLSTES